jgi:hypothetical protein
MATKIADMTTTPELAAKLAAVQKEIEENAQLQKDYKANAKKHGLKLEWLDQTFEDFGKGESYRIVGFDTNSRISNSPVVASNYKGKLYLFSVETIRMLMADDAKAQWDVRQTERKARQRANWLAQIQRAPQDLRELYGKTFEYFGVSYKIIGKKRQRIVAEKSGGGLTAFSLNLIRAIPMK